MSRLSKFLFLRGLQCHKSLWLYRHRRELRTQPGASQQALFDTGTNVGELAQQLFPGGRQIVFAPDKINENVSKTKELINSGAETIYEASFVHDNVLVMVDILHRGIDGWEIYEVKSSTGMKPLYEHDISVQYFALSGNGLDIARAALIHINSKYERNGDLDIKQLFAIETITDAVIDHQPFVKDRLCLMRDMLDGTEPQIDIGPHCSDPYDCDFHEHCWKHIPENSVFNLYRLNSKKKFDLYQKGIIKFDDIPSDYRLSEAQQLQVDAELNMKDFINPDGIMKFLEQLEGPIGMLDFETFTQAVPSFDGQRPYQKIVFQYSLHILDGAKLEHLEFLGEPGKDPREELADRMITDTKYCKTILVYNIGFERTIVRDLTKRFPDKADDLQSIINRMLDMMTPFQNKDYYTKEMRGKYSIKLVLPALIPELRYDDLDIGDGGMAMDAYAKLQTMTDTHEIEKIKSDLLKYCELDTFAMVKILEKLKEVV